MSYEQRIGDDLMKLEIINSISEYFKFIDEIYEADEFFKDNKKGLINVICSEKSAFYKKSKQKMIRVTHGGQTLCQCILIYPNNSKEELSFSFFEALKGVEEAVNILMDEGISFGKSLGAKKIIIGLDGHCNNALGYIKKVEDFPGFGEVYNKDYYGDYFADNSLYKEIKFVSFKGKIAKLRDKLERDSEKLFQRMWDIEFEKGDFSNSGFEKTMKRYTDFGNNVFGGHDYYYRRDYDEDYELFDSMRILLKNENMIFAKKDGEDIGLIFWYPDFNELVGKGKGAGIWTVIKYRVLGIRPKVIKIMEIGLKEKYKNTAIIGLLFKSVYDIVAGRYTDVVSNWIMNDNLPSKKISKRYIEGMYKDYYLYERNIGCL